MTSGEDLSSGEVSELRQKVFDRQLREEDERLSWKTRVLRASAAFIVIFYGVLFAFIFIRMSWVNPESTNLILGILAGVPTLLAINLLKMVAKPVTSKDTEDFEKNALLALGKEVVEVFRSWVAKAK